MAYIFIRSTKTFGSAIFLNLSTEGMIPDSVSFMRTLVVPYAFIPINTARSIPSISSTFFSLEELMFNLVDD